MAKFLKDTLNIASDITGDIASDMKIQLNQLILTESNFSIATVIKLQVMKIIAMLLTQPTDIAIIASFISNQIVCSYIQHTFFSKGSRISPSLSLWLE
jgi:hypothetical protein